MRSGGSATKQPPPSSIEQRDSEAQGLDTDAEQNTNLEQEVEKDDDESSEGRVVQLIQD